MKLSRADDDRRAFWRRSRNDCYDATDDGGCVRAWRTSSPPAESLGETHTVLHEGLAQHLLSFVGHLAEVIADAIAGSPRAVARPLRDGGAARVA